MKKVDPGFLNGLNKLEQVWLNKNDCIDILLQGISIEKKGTGELISAVRNQCNSESTQLISAQNGVAECQSKVSSCEQEVASCKTNLQIKNEQAVKTAESFTENLRIFKETIDQMAATHQQAINRLQEQQNLNLQEITDLKRELTNKKADFEEKSKEAILWQRKFSTLSQNF